MKQRSFLLVAILAAMTGLSVFLSLHMTPKKICSINKHCPSKSPSNLEPQGSSPDDFHFNGMNRLIVSTFK